MSGNPIKPAEAAAPPPPAPGLGELFERSLAGLVLGRAAYEALGSRPAPSYGLLWLLAAGFAVAGLGLNALFAALADPRAFAAYPPLMLAAVAAVALGAALAGLLLASLLFHGLGRVLGGEAGFERAFQAAAMLAALAPLQSLSGLFPYAWLLPSALFIWAGAGALAGLLRARFGGALAACAALGLLCAGAQAVARAAVAKAQRLAVEAQAALQAGQDAAAAAAMLQALQAAQMPTPEPGLSRPAGTAAGAGASGLDMLRGPGVPDEPSPADPRSERRLLQQGDALRQSAEGMLESVIPMLSNPALTKGLDAQGQADLKELQSIMADIKRQSAAGTLDSKDQAALMGRIQAVSMRLMMSSMRAKPQPAPAKAGGGKP